MKMLSDGGSTPPASTKKEDHPWGWSSFLSAICEKVVNVL